MRDRLTIHYFLVLFTLLFSNVNAQNSVDKKVNSSRISLNEFRKNEKILIKEPLIYLTAKGHRDESLHCQVLKGNDLIKKVTIPIVVGVNEFEISLVEIARDLQNGEVYQFRFEGRYFGKGGFDFHQGALPILDNPIPNFQVIPLEVSCDVISVSSIEFIGGVMGGTAPYQLTWMVSKGPQVKDLINQPLKFELANSKDISRMMVAERLDYYVTLLVEDACGNSGKKVMHIKCSGEENDGMIYFTPIELDKTITNPRL